MFRRTKTAKIRDIFTRQSTEQVIEKMEEEKRLKRSRMKPHSSKNSVYTFENLGAHRQTSRSFDIYAHEECSI